MNIMISFFHKKKHVFFTVLLMITIAQNSYSQISYTLPFENICASPSFNNFNIRITSGTSCLCTSYKFIVELSKVDFVTSDKVYISAAGTITSYPTTVSFKVPVTTSGTTYRIRIRTTSPASVSSSSPMFEAFYRIQNSAFFINGGVNSQTYCSGSGYILKIDDNDNNSNDSPLKFPSLSYKWKKQNGLSSDSSLLSIESKGEYFVNTSAVYYVETNYGSCPSSSISNRVTVTQSTAPNPTSISSSLGNPFCPKTSQTTLSTQPSILYQWYKDDAKINGATNQTYDTDTSGKYSVDLFDGSCSKAFIDLVSLKFTDFTMQPIDPKVKDLVVLSTNAINPSFEWLFNNTPISNAGTSNQYLIEKGGEYKVIVTQNSNCNYSQAINFNVDIPLIKGGTNIPNFISPNNDGKNDTWIIPDEYYSGTGTSIKILNYRGEVEFETDNYLNNWPINSIESSNNIQIYYYIITTNDGNTKKGSITVVN
ncbi:MAG: Gliding motility-associated C-terminal protein [Bacteroidota bacterium]|nr:Gliding motility-associated C-terminal protein [Bacteroidota bacterium]